MKEIGLVFSRSLIIGLLLVSQVTIGERIDPTKPVDYVGLGSISMHTDLVVSSILFAEQRKVAVINGESFSEGDAIGAYRVKKIDVQEVVLASADGEMVLPLRSFKIEKRYLGSTVQDKVK